MALPRQMTSQIEPKACNTKDEKAERLHNVVFCAPLLDYGYPPAVEDLRSTHESTTIRADPPNEKPILLYLPGFDGTYICPFIQFPELGTEFEVWCMTVGMDDRSTYQEIKTMILDFIKNDMCVDDDIKSTAPIRSDESGNQTVTSNKTTNTGFFSGWFGGGSSSFSAKKGRPIYLVGESFGGILATDIAMTLLTEKRNNVNYKSIKIMKDASNTDENTPVNLQGLTLINPATCYERSQLAVKGPQVAKMPNGMYLMGLSSQLLPLFTDDYSVAQLLLILQAKALPSVIDNPLREAYMGRVAISLPTRLAFMPPSTLSWRLEEWLQTGSKLMRDASFQSFPKFRTLVIVGEKDRTLPSIAEAERLANKVMLPSQTQIHVVEGAGHASTCGSRLDLAAIMRNRFEELQSTYQQKRRKEKTADNEPLQVKRTSMKKEALRGEGPFFGMEERYDKASIGLNPIKYWSKSNYKRVRAKVHERQLIEPTSTRQIIYKRTKYSPK
jgi:pimeloyl-ACP methyl ester carboxylesterase